MMWKQKNLWKVSFLLGLWIGIIGFLSLSSGEEKAPRLQFDNKLFEFGRTIQGEDVEKIFSFENTGNAPLRIIKIKSSCQCAPSLLSKKILEPGEKGQIKVVFHTLGLLPQYYDLYVDIYHNDPEEKDNGSYVSRLRLSGEVVMLYKIAPMGAEYLGIFESTSPPTRILLIVPLQSSSVSIKKISYSQEKLDIKVEPERLVDGTIAQKLTVQIKKGQPAGEFFCPVEIHTNDPKQPVIFFKMWGQAMGELSYEPNYIVFGPVKRNSDRSRTITIFQRKGLGLKILKVVCDLDFFQVENDEVLPGKKFEITLKVKENAPEGPFAKEIWIYTNNPEQPLLKAIALGSMFSQVRLSPEGIYISKGASFSGEAGSLKISLPDSKTSLQIKKWNLPSFLKPHLVRSEGSSLAMLSIQCDGKTTSGDFWGEIILSSNLPGEEEIKIPVFGTISP